MTFRTRTRNRWNEKSTSFGRVALRGAASALTASNGARRRKTQLDVIRNVMESAAERGLWLTLDEIARDTQFGEASISAQLRHLRKTKFGGCRVEKRVRRERKRRAAARNADAHVVWEYRVSHLHAPRKPSDAAEARERV